MMKFITDITGSVVVLFQERAKIGLVRSLIIDPENANFLGFVTSQYSGEKEKIVSLKNVKGFGNGIVMIDDHDSLSDVEDIVEIEKMFSNNPEIIKSKVFTESGQKLGRVIDATINLDTKSIENIYVESGVVLRVLSDQLIIPKNKIIKIEEKKIIVTDSVAKIGEKKLETAHVAIAE